MKENLRKEVRGSKQFFHGDLVRKKAAEHGIPDKDIIDFSTNINPHGPPTSTIEALKNNIKSISKYPDNNPQGLKNKLADYAGTSPARIIIGNGSNDLIYLISRAILERDDKVTIVEPTFTEFRRAVMKQGGEIKSIRLKEENDYKFNLKDSEYEIERSTKLLFLCSPNNPSGGMIPKKQLKKLVKEAEDKNAFVVLDEAFFEFCDSPDRYNSAEFNYGNLIIIRSPTKFFGIPGLRFGYGIVPDNIFKEISGAQITWNVNSLAQIATKVSIQDEEFAEKTREIIREGKKFLKEKLEKIENLKVFPSDANFFLLKIEDDSVDAPYIVEELLKKGMAVRPCQDFRFLDENYLRISVRKKEDCIKLIENLKKVLA